MKFKIVSSCFKLNLREIILYSFIIILDFIPFTFYLAGNWKWTRRARNSILASLAVTVSLCNVITSCDAVSILFLSSIIIVQYIFSQLIG
ncbi:hypothetical protein LguiB_015068 [Lonicera macranthoides]